MENCQSTVNDGFKVVAYKRKKSVKINSKNNSNILQSEDTVFDKNYIIRRTLEAKEDILSSDFNHSLNASLNEALCAIENPEIKEFICLGLGKISNCMIARYQLALLLCLKDRFKDIIVYAFDPVFGENDFSILKHFGLIPLVDNKEGKYTVHKPTLFFMPHCPKQLTNNLLFANWGVNLSNVIIIANSINNIVNANLQKDLFVSGYYLMCIVPHLIEIAIINSFKFYDVFNDTAIHLFPKQKLSILSKNFWEKNDEPIYANKDLEFIMN